MTFTMGIVVARRVCAHAHHRAAVHIVILLCISSCYCARHGHHVVVHVCTLSCCCGEENRSKTSHVHIIILSSAVPVDKVLSNRFSRRSSR